MVRVTAVPNGSPPSVRPGRPPSHHPIHHRRCRTYWPVYVSSSKLLSSSKPPGVGCAPSGEAFAEAVSPESTHSPPHSERSLLVPFRARTRLYFSLVLKELACGTVDPSDCSHPSGAAQSGRDRTPPLLLPIGITASMAGYDDVRTMSRVCTLACSRLLSPLSLALAFSSRRASPTVPALKLRYWGLVLRVRSH